ncbi:MAG TPA: orotidine-5'-phosphate decarboxylase [bacterium]|nr:orotidine-5'-phosphate decarboxylase [bacterium]
MTDRVALGSDPQLIVALDVPSLEEARRFIDLLRPSVLWFKVGLELFAAAGPAAVDTVHRAGGRVFLDLKLHDIPTTVAGAVFSAAGFGVEMLTLHLAGGERMVRAAVEAARGTTEAPRLLGVFRLTSDPPSDRTGGSWDTLVTTAARAAVSLRLDGLIAAASEVPLVRSVTPSGFLTVSPGIRPAGDSADDQARTATPAEAVRAGSDFLVVGRPITRHPEPLAAAQRILEEVRAALTTAAT